MRFWVLGLVMCVLFSFSVNAEWTEISNASSISSSGTWVGVSNVYDDNSTSYGYDNDVGVANATLLLNYSVSSFSSAYWMVKDACNTTNLSLVSCDDSAGFRFKIDSDLRAGVWWVHWNCWNGSAWTNLQLCTSDQKVYEESLWYDSIVPSVPSLASEAEGFSTSLLTFGVIVLILFGLVVSKKEYSKYAVLVLLLGGVGFGIWFLTTIIG